MHIKHVISGIGTIFTFAIVAAITAALLAIFKPDYTGLAQAIWTGSKASFGVAVCLTLGLLILQLSNTHRKIVMVATMAVMLVSPAVSWLNDYLIAGAALAFVPLLLFVGLGLKLEKT